MRLALSLIVAATLATPASAYVTQRGQIVTPDGPDTFTVPYKGLSGATDFWCAAGQYVHYGLGVPNNHVLYRTSEPPRRSGKGISFSLRPDNQASRTGIAVFGGQASGGGMSVGAAQGFCQQASMRHRR